MPALPAEGEWTYVDIGRDDALDPMARATRSTQATLPCGCEVVPLPTRSEPGPLRRGGRRVDKRHSGVSRDARLSAFANATTSPTLFGLTMTAPTSEL
jgi:hypothetical protein